MNTKDVLLFVVTSNKFIQEKKYMFKCKVVIKENMKLKKNIMSTIKVSLFSLKVNDNNPYSFHNN